MPPLRDPENREYPRGVKNSAPGGEAGGGVIKADYLLSSYKFHLPPELVAQRPPARRGESRLYLLERAGEEGDRVTRFERLPELLPPGTLLVANNARVIPARITGRRESGGALELLLLTPPPLLEAGARKAGGWKEAEAEALFRPARKVRPGRGYVLGEGLAVTALEKPAHGRARVVLSWQGELPALLRLRGSLPLPPYIRRAPEELDLERYQTVYAAEDKAGALAAPTAGLHFTPALREALLAAGHFWAELTLFVGYGTFSPVRTQDIRLHRLHAEYAELPEESARSVLRARAEGRAVLAVGTTSARVLEGVAETLARRGEKSLLAPHAGWLDTFIYPGRPFRVVDALLTNFHLPESTLLMLVSALAGRERLLRAYARAVREGFRFFSYGDAMLIR
ncbi:MAG: tRNA preQ1(34) S-adenosylmethionine ribosyltransferase-isomerase QueA [Deltaproteobacteria bacterium]|jgi:S-adenosylmethionine:tRNA ribosyltransferase-isomerase|nr:tRNA preQ1(34) S-adenosylmethionine ribosyltransferase-isomerase QueA [Deltaproteobacteria bacterium]